MAELPINYLDTWKVARDKINDSFEALETTVAWYRPHIEDWIRWIGNTNTWVKAVWDSISMKVEDWYIWYKSSSVNTWTQIIATSALAWPTGNGIAHTSSSKSWKTTTVVMHYTNWGSDSFTVQDWEDWIDVGAVIWPNSSTDGDVVLFDGATGKLVKDSWKKLPTKVSDLSNDSGFITSTVNNLENYYLKSQTYTKAEVDSMISNFGGFEVVSTLPTADIKTNVIYLLWPIWSWADKYEEWIYSDSTWVKIWETSVDLSNYFNTSTQTSDAITEWSTNLFLTASERTILWNTSWTNTGDQTASDFDIKDLTDSTGLRTTWSGKQDALVSGTNIKTVNNESILGSWNISISWWGSDIVYATQAEYTALLPWAESDGKHYFIYSTSGGWGWQPWANTIAYYKFNNSLVDSSGNNNDLTGTPFWYWTWVEWEALINKSNTLTSPINSNFISWAFTIAFLYGTGDNATLQRLFQFRSNPNIDIQMEFYNDFSWIQIYNNANSVRIAFPFAQPSIWDWHSIVLTWDGVNQIECYIDWTKVNAYSNYNTTFTYPSPNGYFYINEYHNSSQEDLLDELVIENKHWTQTDVDSYLANYNLS